MMLLLLAAGKCWRLPVQVQYSSIIIIASSTAALSSTVQVSTVLEHTVIITPKPQTLQSPGHQPASTEPAVCQLRLQLSETVRQSV